jgi:formamidopyrimidine-DNA glycosylase
MPEYPEVKVISTQLNQKLRGAKLISLSLPHKISKGTPIGETLCKGKTIYTKIGPKYLVSHLMLHGKWFYGEYPYKGLICKMKTTAGTFTFGDNMGLAKIELLDSRELKDRLDRLGPDPQTLTLTELKELLKSNSSIVNLLMNQKKISGIGNYLRAEILYGARISPLRKSSSLKPAEILRLYNVIMKLTKEIIKKGGSQSAEQAGYRDIYGNMGRYKMKVYGQTAVGGKKISIIRIQNRAVYYVSFLQK